MASGATARGAFVAALSELFSARTPSNALEDASRPTTRPMASRTSAATSRSRALERLLERVSLHDAPPYVAAARRDAAAAPTAIGAGSHPNAPPAFFALGADASPDASAANASPRASAAARRARSSSVTAHDRSGPFANGSYRASFTVRIASAGSMKRMIASSSEVNKERRSTALGVCSSRSRHSRRLRSAS